MSLWGVLEQAMLEHADRPALGLPGEPPMSYRELREEVRFRAAALRRFIPPGSRVGVWFPEPCREAVHVLALIALEAVIIPVNGKYGEARCTAILRHTEPDVLLTTGGPWMTPQVIAACAAAGTSILTPETVQAGRRFGRPGPREREGRDVPPAFIMYTSGSTGQPKGAVLPYSSVLANMRDICAYFAVSPGDHLLIHRALSHASVLTGELLLGLACGARVTLYDEPFLPRRLLGTLQREEVTVFCTTPSVFYQLAEDRSGLPLPRLRSAALMGEYLHRQVAQRLRSRFPDTDFYMLYGQTEASPRITYLPPGEFTVREGSIGLPLRGLEVRVIGEDGRELPPGAEGELIVRGPSLFWGYWDAPALTAAKLRGGWLHTGDMVTRRSDGYLYIAGRRDDMMIRAGVNVYPREIEELLLEDGRIREVVVFGTPDPRYGQRIQVCAVPEPGRMLTPADVLDLCRASLPPGHCPDGVEIVAEIPRTAAGKRVRSMPV